jgi:NADH-quinone oxidoreductase subunit G
VSEAVRGLDRAGEKTAAIAGGETTNEEGYLLQFLVREVLRSPHVDSRTSGVLDAEQARVLARPDLSAAVSDIDWAGTVLVLDTELVEEAPILDLRVRKAARRQGCQVVVATRRPARARPRSPRSPPRSNRTQPTSTTCWSGRAPPRATSGAPHACSARPRAPR